MKKFLFVLSIALFLVILSFAIYYFLNTKFVVITNSKNEKIRVKVLVAKTSEEKTKGLSILDTLPEAHGMLFINNEDSNIPFWMYEMKFPIDIIFLNSDKRILKIFKDAQPCKSRDMCPLIYPGDAYRYVLEVNSNFTSENNINVGNTLTWK